MRSLSCYDWRDCLLHEDFAYLAALLYDVETVLCIGYAHTLEIEVYGSCVVGGLDVGDAACGNIDSRAGAHSQLLDGSQGPQWRS